MQCRKWHLNALMPVAVQFSKDLESLYVFHFSWGLDCVFLKFRNVMVTSFFESPFKRTWKEWEFQNVRSIFLHFVKMKIKQGQSDKWGMYEI